MNGDRVLLDSVVVIDHLNGIDAATGYIRSVLGRAAVSAITRAEVLTGFAPAAASVVRAFLDRFETIPIDAPVADLAAELRREHGWKLPDAFQAAIASLGGLLLATRDARAFDPDKHAFVLIPYEV